MQRRICLVDLVTAREPVRPDVAELIEMIEASAGDKGPVRQRSHGRLQKSGCFLRLIADGCRLRSECLGNKRPLLARVHAAVKKSRRKRKPRRWSQIVLIIDRRSLEKRARWPNEPVLVRIVQLPLVIVTEDEFVFPPTI